MMTTTVAGVARAVASIRRLHAIGVASWKKHAVRIKPGEWHTLAKGADFSPDLYNKARAFASAYTRKDLDDLCDLCTKHRSAATCCSTWVFSTPCAAWPGGSATPSWSRRGANTSGIY